MVKNLLPMQEMRVQSLHQEDALEKEMTPNFRTLAWKIHGQRSLVGYSPWCCRVGPDVVTERYTRVRKREFGWFGRKLLGGS